MLQLRNSELLPMYIRLQVNGKVVDSVFMRTPYTLMERQRAINALVENYYNTNNNSNNVDAPEELAVVFSPFEPDEDIERGGILPLPPAKNKNAGYNTLRRRTDRIAFVQEHISIFGGKLKTWQERPHVIMASDEVREMIKKARKKLVYQSGTRDVDIAMVLFRCYEEYFLFVKQD